MTTQTTYASNISPPPPGTIAGGMDSAYVSTGICETVSPGIPFGRAVSQGTLSDQGIVIAGAAAAFKGISVRDVTLRGDLAVVDAYLPLNSMGVLEEGDIWVEPSVAVAANDPVFYEPLTGVFRNILDTDGIAVARARFKTSCGVGGRAIITLAGGRNA
jgi:hypothetical protein